MYKGFAVIVVGRYRQSKETEEGDTGMSKVAKIAERFSSNDTPPSSREINASRDQHNRVAFDLAANPLVRECFTPDEWKCVLKARDTISERVTGVKGGKLSDQDPAKMDEQVRLYALEVESQGWGLESP